MGRVTRYNYIGTGDSWGRELLLVFVFGFVAATVLWLGGWYVYARPAQAASLKSCEAEKSELTTLRAKVETEKEDAAERLAAANASLEEASVKLDDALVGWGRCIRSNNQDSEETGEGALSSELSPAAKTRAGQN
jgi:hypothetical protein